MTDKLIDLADTPARLNARGELLVITLGEGDRQDACPTEKQSSETVENFRGKGSGEPPFTKGAPLAPCSAMEPQTASSRPSRLRGESSQKTEVTVPMSEIAAVIASHPRVSFSRAAVAGLAAAGASLIVCDDLRLPAAMLLPLHNHFVQAERFALQAAAPLPLCKQLWKQIIVAKIRAQGRLLEEIRGDSAGLPALAARVRSGDPDNLEAQAARRYWTLLFDDPDFIRDRAGGGPNPLLNYGYTVLRAVVVRAVCAAGLHPSIALHHHNRYDTFRLASDLMEPFRPAVDRAVVGLCRSLGMDAPLNKDAKAELLGALGARFTLEGESRTLFDIAARSAASLADVFAGKRKKLVLPEI